MYLTPYSSTLPYIRGQSKIHQPNYPLIVIVSTILSPTYILSSYLKRVLLPLTFISDGNLKFLVNWLKLLKKTKFY